MMKLLLLLIDLCLLEAIVAEGSLSEMLDPILRNQNEIRNPGVSWWWNLKIAHGEQMTGDEFYYPDQETLIRFGDGGYHYWWWKNIILKFENGTIIKKQQVETTSTTSTTSTTTTTTPKPPTTTTSKYPAWPATCLRTGRDALGPFYWPFVPFPQRDRICTDFMSNNQLDVSGYVFVKTSSDCSAMTPQANAKVEIWLADPSGNYKSECVGYVMTDSQGFYSFTTTMPGIYPGRPRHIHYQITTERNVQLVTQMYLDSDTSRGRNPDLTVIDREISSGHRAARFDFVL